MSDFATERGIGASARGAPPVTTVLAQGCVALIAVGWLGCFLLISPPQSGTVSGQIPWSDGSLLRQIVDAISLWGIFPTARGAEIKNVIWHGVVVLATLLLAVRAWNSIRHLRLSATVREPWMAGQIMLLGWCGLALLSFSWSREPAISFGQAILYCFGVVWALAIAWTLERAALQRLGRVVLVSSAAMATLTIWYYFERNPNHRPGFPLGNPGPLAAAMVPALLLAGSTLVSGVWNRLMTGVWRDAGGCLLSGLVLIPLVFAFLLADALTAKVALIVGVGVLLWLSIPGKARWVVAGIAMVAAVGAIGYRFAAADDFGMARGASARLRLYTWRYAAELWEQSPMLGLGAGAYARLANVLSLRDEQLDPAAFMGTWRNHAHNELFEVFTEIGLVGGVTFVGGHLATILAALLVLRRRLTTEQRTVIVAFLAAYVGILADSCGSVSLRLPGFPIVFFTLIGVLWAAGRWGSRGDLAGDALAAFLPDSPTAARRLNVRRMVMALGVVVLAGGLATAGTVNAHSLWYEQKAHAAMADDLPELARSHAAEAEWGLLEPTRRIMAAELQARAMAYSATGVFAAAVNREGGLAAVPEAERERIAGLLRMAYNQVEAFDKRIPAVGEMPILGAELAERLAVVLEPTAPETARQWRERALAAWQGQRIQNRYDLRACLALTRYPALPASYGVLLRDALRRGTPKDATWLNALQGVVQRLSVPVFDQVVEALLKAAGPIDPQTDANAIVISMAPEAFRLGAAWWSFRGDHERALRLAGRAADLYRPIQDRFPTRVAVALSEQAEYMFRWQPAQPQAAIELITTAIEALPHIQAQARDELERPLRVSQARYQIAAGRTAAAEELLRNWGWESPARIAAVYLEVIATVLRQPIERRPRTVIPWLERVVTLTPTDVGGWRWLAWIVTEPGHYAEIERVLAQARDAGVSESQAAGIRQWLAGEFPAYGAWIKQGRPSANPRLDAPESSASETGSTNSDSQD